MKNKEKDLREAGSLGKGKDTLKSSAASRGTAPNTTRDQPSKDISSSLDNNAFSKKLSLNLDDIEDD